MSRPLPLPDGTRVQTIPKEGVIVGHYRYRVGRTKQDAEDRYAYIVAWNDGGRESLAEREIEPIKEAG